VNNNQCHFNVFNHLTILHQHTAIGLFTLKNGIVVIVSIVISKLHSGNCMSLNELWLSIVFFTNDWTMFAKTMSPTNCSLLLLIYSFRLNLFPLITWYMTLIDKHRLVASSILYLVIINFSANLYLVNFYLLGIASRREFNYFYALLSGHLTGQLELWTSSSRCPS